MNRYFKILSLFVSAAALNSCGDNGGEEAPQGKEFAQDVRFISYGLNSLRLHIDQNTKKGARESIDKQLQYAKGESKDKVERVIEEADFILKVNDKKAAVKVSSQGKMEYRQTVQKTSPGCTLSGTSSIQGEASPLRFNLSWDFNVHLEGDSCDGQIKTEFVDFLNAEVDALNFSSVRDLIKATDQESSSSNNFHLTLQLSGEGH